MNRCACAGECRCEVLERAVREALEAMRAGEVQIAEQILERARSVTS